MAPWLPAWPDVCLYINCNEDVLQATIAAPVSLVVSSGMPFSLNKTET